ncbi:retinoblastoma-like protein 2 [Centropristis striata]|uniref:retinoblastoma-like protein 2 n=1 Tax=Centropristis striata TaxID=184440 RepID=UPI0027E02751|nr:retinoblastoma-like protein 2 [Centropristis striata]
MSEEDEFVQKARAGFEDLCRALNMDEEASSEAWKTYQNISRNFTLEGSELHWLACALYVACRSSVPTVGKGTAEGNYVSLTRILRCSEMSLIEFFNKMKKWQDMSNLPQDFRQSTHKLERNFTVSAVIFKKYVPIFKAIFKAPLEEPPRVHRSRKQRRHPCTVTEVFNFCWVLFVHAKGNFPMISDDLVNSYHLLLCALDLVFTNALLCNARKDLLNPSFRGLPEDFGSKDYRPSSGPYCFMEQLCELHDGLVLEAKGVKEHFWKPFIKKLFHKRIIRGKEDSLTGFLDPMNFGDSFLSLTRVYEEHVLATGSLDERIFTNEGASEDIGTPGPCLSEGAENQDSATYRLHTSLTASALKVSTPLTGRKYVQENSLASPVSSAMKSVGRLHTLLSGTKQGPSAKLTETLRNCARDPSDVIKQRLKDMFELLCQHYEGSGAESRGMGKDMAVKYFHLAEALYFRILESITEREKMILGDADLSCILEQDVFHRSLLTCCLEIVVFSYRPPGDFPNLISIFQLPAYQFYKVIEVLVRSEQGLFREVVKHLNQVEEQVLESLAWTSDSPLWESLRGAKDQVPACQQVMPPQYLEQSEESTPANHGPELNQLTNSSIKGVSPSPTTLLDRYSSPPTGQARRRLFIDPVDGEARVTSTSTASTVAPTAATKTGQANLVTAIPAGQTVVTMATATVTANNGQTVTIPVQGIANESGGITFIPVQVSVTGQGGATLQPLSAQTLTGTLTVQSALTKPAATTPTSSPLRKGSLSLFFRKVYHLASVRLRDLCAKLDISSELRRKIWTCFEYSLVHCTELMRDRHLDQLLMCAVYVMARVTKEDKSFQNIMKCYRTQPQASSNVYRSVLISGRRKSHSDTNETNKHSSPADSSQDPAGGDISPVCIRSSSTMPTPQPGSAPSTPTNTSNKTLTVGDREEERGDLIHFYNNIYIKQMRNFALKYSVSSPSAGVETPPLCPYPSMRTGSPRRMLLSSKHSIYISPHKTGSAPSLQTPQDKIYYYICSSPPNRLQEINSMIRTGETPTRKRSLPLEEETSPKRVCPDNHSALLRRLQDVANDRSSSH